jgi:FKBP-type peptidyl-prolyl cis-trans isomerase
MENKKNMILWFLIVIIVIAGLVYITINKKKNSLPTEQIGQEENANSLPTEQLGQEENKNMENTQENGVKITILKEGTGAVAKSGDTVAMNYTGTLANGTAFDSNVDQKFQHVEPFVFTIGGGQVIKGWDVGIAGMKIGEKRKLELTPEFAYGENGYPGVIPPNSTLIFEVELLGINK